MKSILFSLTLLSVISLYADSQTIQESRNLENDSAQLVEVLKKTVNMEIIPDPTEPELAWRHNWKLTSQDGAFVLECSEGYFQGFKVSQSCELVIDSEKSKEQVTAFSIGTYTPVIVVTFINDVDAENIEKMLTQGYLASLDKTSVATSDGKKLLIPNWRFEGSTAEILHPRLILAPSQAK